MGFIISKLLEKSDFKENIVHIVKEQRELQGRIKYIKYKIRSPRQEET